LSRAGRIRIGICSWADPALIESGAFYPRKSMTAEARLRHYASVFDTVEVNSSYYAIPDAKTTARWVERTPADFVFNVKAYALLTGHHPRAESLPAEVQALLPRNSRRTRRGEVEADEVTPEALDATFRLYRRAIEPLLGAGKLGYVLFQFAPWVRFERARLEYLTSLPERLPGVALAVEFRHRSWLPEHREETLGALRAAGLGNVVVDSPPTSNAVPRVAVVTAPTAILRLHGRNRDGWLRQLRGEEPAVREKYDYLYTTAELEALVSDVEHLTEDAEQVFVSFNNNNRDYPVRNALMMRRLLGLPGPAASPGSLLPGLFA